MENREKKKWLEIYSDLSNKLRVEGELQNNRVFMKKLLVARKKAVKIIRSQKA